MTFFTDTIPISVFIKEFSGTVKLYPIEGNEIVSGKAVIVTATAVEVKDGSPLSLAVR